MLAAAVLSVAALSGHVLVAHLVELLARLVLAPIPPPLLLLARGRDALPVGVETRVVLAVLKAAAISVFALAVVTEVKADATWRGGDLIALGVLELWRKRLTRAPRRRIRVVEVSGK